MMVNLSSAHSAFIKLLSSLETNNIKVFRGNKRSAIERVPIFFSSLLQYVIPVLQSEIIHLRSNSNETLVIFGIQPAAQMRKTCYDTDNGAFITHLCCTLDFMLVPDEILAITSHENLHYPTQSILIDFTTGEILDVARYLDYLYDNNSLQGRIYGNIPMPQLKWAWINYEASTHCQGQTGHDFYQNPFNDTILEQKLDFFSKISYKDLTLFNTTQNQQQEIAEQTEKSTILLSESSIY